MDPRVDNLRMTPREIERFWGFVVVDDVSDCWVWTGGRINGYGHFWLRGKTRKAHRVAYETWRGPIPWPLEIDHVVCDFESCCNPWHLKPATALENTLRSGAASAVNARKTHCACGEPLSGDNLLPCSGRLRRRKCRACNRRRCREYDRTRARVYPAAELERRRARSRERYRERRSGTA